MDCSPPGSSVHGISQARVREWCCHALLQWFFQTQGSNQQLLSLLHWQVGSFPRGPPGSRLSFVEGAKLCPLSRYLVSLPSFFFVCFVFLSFLFFSSYFLALLLIILLWIWVSQSLMDIEELGRGREVDQHTDISQPASSECFFLK